MEEKTRVKIRLCKVANADHRLSHRIYAHTYHYPDTICCASAFQDLPDKHLYAILAHEVGHLITGPEAGEFQANQEANRYFKIKIRYKPQTRYGINLQVLSPEHIQKVIDALDVTDALDLIPF
jgi:hypothetical protein